MSATVNADDQFDATSYEIMQNCLAEAESHLNSDGYVQYCVDGYLTTQQITSTE